MKVLIVNEMGTGRDSSHRISSIAKILKDNFAECEVVFVSRKSKEDKFLSKRVIDKIIQNPYSSFFSSSAEGAISNLASVINDNQHVTKNLQSGWEKILKDINPDFVIADNAPVSHALCIKYAIPFIGTGGSDDNLNNLILDNIPRIDGLFNWVGTDNLEKSNGITLSPFINTNSKLKSCHFDYDNEEDGGLKIDIFAYIRQNDPFKNDLILALDEINDEQDKNVLVVMPGIEPILYRKNFEVTPNFVKMQGALFNAPLCINNFSSGMIMESIRTGCMSWGIPFNKEQATNRSQYKNQINHVCGPNSKADIKQSLINAIQQRDETKDHIKTIWLKQIRDGRVSLSSALVASVRSLSE